MAGGAVRILFSALVFVLSGLIQTICVQAVLYSGGGDRSTFLVALPNYFGILLVYVVGARAFRSLDRLGVWEARRRSAADPAANRVHVSLYVSPTLNEKRAAAARARPIGFFARLVHPERRKLFVLAFNELGGFLTGITGLSIAGSGLYQVVFSGGTVFTALLSVFFLRKRLTYSQWLFVGVITLGLMITAEQVTHSPAGDEGHAANVISGIAFVLVSCLFYSTNYVIAEHFLDVNEVAAEVGGVGGGGGGGEPPIGPAVSVDGLGGDSTPNQSESVVEDLPPPLELPPPSGLDLSLYTGGSCLVLFGAYVMVHTVPHWNELVTLSIARHHGDYYLIGEQYFYLALAAFLHAISHYDIVATVGAVPVGVLNAVRAVSVFGVSSLLFCEHQASQCYTARKGVSTAIVILGAAGYSIVSAAATRRGRGPLLPTDRRAKTRRRSTDGSGGLERSVSAPFLGDPALLATTGASWFGFGKRRKEAET
jgi:hypothetical protein